MNDRTELVVITIARNAVMFLSLVLPVAHLVDDFDVVGNHKLPIAETLAENFVGLPSEESLRSGRPAQHSEFLIPLDDCEWRVLDVESESSVIVCGCCFGEFAFRNVANDCDSAYHVTVFVVTW